MKILKAYLPIICCIIVAILAISFSHDAQAQDTAFNMRFKQRNAADNGDVDRFVAPPATGSNCLFFFNGSTVLPTCASIGAGLALTDGVLTSTATGSAQVNSDWTATSGPARILNKPSISMVGMTGQYADLLGAPSLATVATTGAYADLAGKPSIPAAQVPADWSSTTGVSRILNKPTLAAVATSGSWNDLIDKPAIPSAIAPRVYAYRTPALATCFQLSATRDVQVSYAVDITVTLTLTGGARGSVFLRSYTDSACTAGQQTLVGGSSGLPASLSVTVGLQNLGTVALPAVVPAGAWVRIETTSDAGTPTFAARSGQEVQL